MNAREQFNIFSTALMIGVGATAASFGVAVGFFGVEQPSILELLAVATSYASTFLFVLQRRQCYVWGVVTTLLYAELFRQYGLVGSAVVQLYLLGALVYGFWRWGPDGSARPVTLVSSVWWYLGYVVLTAATAAGALAIFRYFESPVPRWDMAILSLSILAQWLLDNKKLETWVIWIAVNLVAIPLYASMELWLVSIQYVVFLANAFWGFAMWRKSMLEARATPVFGRAAA